MVNSLHHIAEILYYKIPQQATWSGKPLDVYSRDLAIYAPALLNRGEYGDGRRFLSEAAVTAMTSSQSLPRARSFTEVLQKLRNVV